MAKQKLLIIVGPTASGKSALGVHLARKFGGEVISADSRQVYKELNIGTGKITKREMKGVPHHLLDVTSPRNTYTAYQFATDGTRAIATIHKRNKVAFVVGGTGFYIDILLGRVTTPNVPPNSRLRAKLGKKSASELYKVLARRDPNRAAVMNTPSERNNKQRLIRAIEITKAEGSVPPYKLTAAPYDLLWIGINPPLAELEKRIKKRLAARIKQGMVAEARKLKAGGLSYRRMEELGLEYRSLARFLQNKITRPEMIEELQRDIRRYAKKQLAYWKRNKDITWFNPTDTLKIEKEVSRWLKS